MNHLSNEFGQPIGEAVLDWTACAPIPKTTLAGVSCTLEILNPIKHAESLFAAFNDDQGLCNWTYMPYGPFENYASFYDWLKCFEGVADPLFFTVLENVSGRALGMASYLRIEPAMGVAEVGHIHFSPQLQHTALATEAMYLMMKRVFDECGFRRYEWKCDSLNEKSRQAALRLGFTFEGIFRQAVVYKNRNRDTAWYSVLDKEWPELKSAFEQWLNPGNFDSLGVQRRSLSDFRD